MTSSPNQDPVARASRRPVSEHAEAIARLHSESFAATYWKPGDGEHNRRVIEEATAFVTPERIKLRADLLQASLDNPDEHFYSAAYDDETTPLGLIYGTKDADKQEIYALYVNSAHQGEGIGRQLVNSYLAWADPTRPVELGVWKENRRAQGFYASMGFKALGDERESFYDFIPETTMSRPPTIRPEVPTLKPDADIQPLNTYPPELK